LKDIYVIRIPSNSSSKEPLVWIAALGDECIGHVRLSIEHNKIKYHDAWVHPDYRRQGVYTMLWKARDTYAKQYFAGQKSYAWCKEGSLPTYLKNGYEQKEICILVEKDLES
jgi:GNAT superfamily N-acetyltransferase